MEEISQYVRSSVHCVEILVRTKEVIVIIIVIAMGFKILIIIYRPFNKTTCIYSLYISNTFQIANLIRKVKSEVTKLCPTLWYPMDCSLLGSSVHGIVQARVLEWVTISFSRGSSWPRDQTWASHIASRHFTIWATLVSEKYLGWCRKIIRN